MYNDFTKEKKWRTQILKSGYALAKFFQNLFDTFFF